MSERGWQTVHLDDLARIPVEQGLEWRPIRRALGIGAFGVNAYTSERVGAHVVEEHTEGSGQEEVYLVVRGHARFTLDGETVDAPAGTLVYLPDGGVRRGAVSEEEGTTVLAVGGWRDRPFEPSSWEWYFEAYGQEPEQAIATMERTPCASRASGPSSCTTSRAWRRGPGDPTRRVRISRARSSSIRAGRSGRGRTTT